MSFRLVRAFVKDILQHPYGDRQWSVQGLGMLRTYLSKEVRLHIWDPRLETPFATPLHTHPWLMRSTVVSGTVHDYAFRYVLRGDREYQTAVPYMRAKLRCGAGGGLVAEPSQQFWLARTGRTVQVGASYTMLKGAIHASRPDPGTVTVIERQFSGDEDHAYVFWRPTEKWVDAGGSRPATHAEISAATELALNHWRDE